MPKFRTHIYRNSVVCQAAFFLMNKTDCRDLAMHKWENFTSIFLLLLRLYRDQMDVS